MRPNYVSKIDYLLNAIFAEKGIVCRETFLQYMEGYHQGKIYTWMEALEVLRILEYTGQIRRGYYVKGMSGAQFVRTNEYAAIMLALQNKEEQLIWLNGVDPALAWGKVLDRQEGKHFMRVSGTVVALYQGEIIAIFEKQGKVLRVMEQTQLLKALILFKEDFLQKRIYNGLTRVVLKEYPLEVAQLLKEAGFMKEMMDYVLYR